MELHGTTFDENVEEHWIEINGNEKIDKEIDYDEVEVDKAPAAVRDKVVQWFTNHEDSYVAGYLFVNTDNSEVEEFQIKDLHHRGEMDRDDILEFIAKFSGMYDVRLVERDEDTDKVHFQIHFD